jgi:hypothetical protein
VTDQVFIVFSVRESAKAVVARREINTRTTWNLDQVAEEITVELCNSLESEQREKCCSATSELTLENLVTGAKAFALIRRLGERAFVNYATATKRGHVCMGCPNNGIVKTGKIGRVAQAKLLASVGRRKTKYDDYLKSCTACACPLRPKVHFTLQVCQAGIPQSVVDSCPEKCWMIKGLEQSKDAPGRALEIRGMRSCASCGG